MIIADDFQTGVTEPAVSVNGATRLDGFLDERQQTLCRGVGDATHTNAPDPWPIFLRGNYNQRYVQVHGPQPNDQAFSNGLALPGHF